PRDWSSECALPISERREPNHDWARRAPAPTKPGTNRSPGFEHAVRATATPPRRWRAGAPPRDQNRPDAANRPDSGTEAAAHPRTAPRATPTLRRPGPLPPPVPAGDTTAPARKDAGSE